MQHSLRLILFLSWSIVVALWGGVGGKSRICSANNYACVCMAAGKL